MSKKVILKYGILGAFGCSSIYYKEDIGRFYIGGTRFGRATKTVLSIVADYRRTLYSGIFAVHTVEYANEKSQVHKRSANKLLDLCCANGGAFIKVGQHLGSLEYLLPSEYVQTLNVLHSQAPKSPLESIHKIIKLELGKEPHELFDSFDSEPLGAASLAQVHKATLKDGRVVAVKVQHPEVLNHSIIDIKGMELLVNLVSQIFPEFKFQWLVNEIKKNLPTELDFQHEGENAERVAKMFTHYPWLKVPAIYWNLSTKRVLTMEYFDGGKVNDLKYCNENNINPFEVTDKLGKLYAEMIFVRGYVHCDPHPGNILIKKNGRKTDVILLDHGLYLDLPENFRLSYGNFWQAVLNRNLKDVEEHSKQLGVGDLYGLFACMVTGRSWKSISKGIDKKTVTKDELDEIKLDVTKFVPQIVEVLARVPREMILIFKTNDCIRGIEYALKTNHSMKSFISMSKCCIRAVYEEKRKEAKSWKRSYKLNIEESYYQFKLDLYTLFLWVLKVPRQVGIFFNLLLF